MNKILLLLFLIIFFISCTTKYVTVPLSTPPEAYKITEWQIKTQKDLFKEYQKTLIKLNEWEAWYSIQTNINKLTITK
ncbi:hypothetical protein BFL38_14510 [Brachyspira hampsonii]|uniref:Uncharacterized protein n=1 Tax=Brachyspira hampsonii TaxID=1287055 RepID=A0A1E5NH74_9SPIR|nr:hypothetical protein [Brachyspira hampsonii]OEJ15494.1 hypothetical protein BFL38_14510 [Brachyspira hampsonii]